ncbi:hypothetical protein MC885_004354 [Smutsia gigantea]|nr:hypothetical protein MC885_004354 [Smutsia gigantea]
MAGAASGAIMEEDYFGSAAEWGDEADGGQAGGSPENVIQLLSENYTAVAQTVNLLAEWLIQTGVEPVQVQETVENHLKSLLIKHFDPRKADSIFTEEGETPAWLEQMIAHTTWRDLFYKLAEAHPDCLMLNFTVKVGGALHSYCRSSDIEGWWSF